MKMPKLSPMEKEKFLKNQSINRIIQWAILITYGRTGKKPTRKEWTKTIESWKAFLGMERSGALSCYNLEHLQNLETLLNKRYEGMLKARGLPFKTGILKQLINYEQRQYNSIYFES